MDLTFYMTANEEAALNKEITMSATKSITFLSNRPNLGCTELLLCTLGVSVCSAVFSDFYLNLFLFHHSLNYFSDRCLEEKFWRASFMLQTKY